MTTTFKKQVSPRMAEYGFIVRCNGQWVASIDEFDSEIDYTDDARVARIFRGQEWADFWMGVEGCDFVGINPNY